MIQVKTRRPRDRDSLAPGHEWPSQAGFIQRSLPHGLMGCQSVKDPGHLLAQQWQTGLTSLDTVSQMYL